MKHRLFLVVLSIFSMATQSGQAALAIPSDGSDGALNITTDTVIDLSQAVTGSWDADNSANAGKGIYDPAKWAVVFKYSSVNVEANKKVSFVNHPSRAPVVWLVNGDVTISGTVALNGEIEVRPGYISEPGPGGFRGSTGPRSNFQPSSGFGPGGGDGQEGQFGLPGTKSYGNPQILPLIGGSGGGYYQFSPGPGGGAGGGAILIAASGRIQINEIGRITTAPAFQSHVGSGGAIRLLGNAIAGNGALDAFSNGRIRLEGFTVSQSFAASVLPSISFTPNPATIWPSPTAPTVRLLSVDGKPVPADPLASLEETPPDLSITTAGVVTVLLETTNFPITGSVTIFIKPRQELQSIHQATLLSGNDDKATWKLEKELPLGVCIIQARAVAQ